MNHKTDQETQEQILKRLIKIESRVEMIHGELRLAAETITRLKLMADQEKVRDRDRADTLEGIAKTIARIEARLDGQAPFKLDQ